VQPVEGTFIREHVSEWTRETLHHF